MGINRNSYKKAYWPHAANEIRANVIDLAGNGRADLKKVIKAADNGLSNYDRKQHHLIALQLQDIKRYAELIDRTLDTIQMVLQNAQPGPAACGDDRIAEILARLERLELSNLNEW